MNPQDIAYALAKQVPDMHRGFTVSTNYGDITIPPGWVAGRMAEHMERALQCELMELKRAEMAQAGRDRHGFSLEASVIGGSFEHRPASEPTAEACGAHCDAPQLSQADGLLSPPTPPTHGSRQ